jgi:hypothetical protein
MTNSLGWRIFYENKSLNWSQEFPVPYYNQIFTEDLKTAKPGVCAEPT